MKMIQTCILGLYIGILCVHNSVTLSLDQDKCADFVTYSRLSFQSSKLDIDTLIRSYHGYKNFSRYTLYGQSLWEYSIDLTCLEHLTYIVNDKVNGKFSDLTQFTTGSKNSSAEKLSNFFKVEYTTNELRKTRLVATVFIYCAQCIESLVLNYNPSLKAIPTDSLSLLKNLTELNVASNGIGSEMDTLQPSSFRGLDQLKTLNLSENHLSITIQASFFIHLRNLNVLNMASTGVAEKLQPGCFEGLEHLQSLNLSENKYIVSKTANLEKQTFRGLTSLKVLDLSGIGLNGYRLHVFDLLGNVTNLTLINFNFYDVEDGIPMGTFMFENNLEEMDLSSRRIFDYTIFIGSLDGLHKLKRLYLRKRILESINLNRSLLSDLCHLNELDISFNRLDENIFQNIAVLNLTLEWLNLEMNQIKLLDLPTFLSTLTKLKGLNLKGNKEIKLNISHFKGLEKLTKLGLSVNQIDRLTSRSFRGLGQLVDLDLSDNLIKTIANGTFAPLAKLKRIDMRRNQLRNLYLFGLSSDCSVLHDGLSLFNISFIDLGQMTGERSKSFLQKTLSLRGRKKLPIYRNIQVDWRSSSEQPNCSLYFFVLREYRVISFKMEQSYIEECLREDLGLIEPSFFQETFENIETIKDYALLKALPSGIEFYGTTPDGYLLGLPNNTSKILFLDLRKKATNYTLELAEKPKNLTIISKDILIGGGFENQSQSLWNISDKSSPIFLANMPHSILADVQFHGSSDRLVTFDRWSRVFCFIDFPLQRFYNNCREFRELKELRDYWNDVPLTIFKNIWLVHVSKLEVRTWSLIDLIKRIFKFPYKWIPYDVSRSLPQNTDHSRYMKHVESLPDDHLMTVAPDGELKIWSILQNGRLRLVQSIVDVSFEKATVFRSNKRNDTLAALCGRLFVKVWSLRFAKLIEIIPAGSNSSMNCISSFDVGLLIIGDRVYQF